MSVDKLIETKTAREVYAPQQSGTSYNAIITSNLGVYRVIDDTVVFHLFEIEENPIFNIEFCNNIYAHILRREVTRVDGSMKESIIAALDANKAIEVSYSSLRLKWEADNFYYIESEGENTFDEKKLLEGVFGTANPGSGRRVYLLPEFKVKHALGEYPEDILMCGCYAERTYFFAQGHASVVSTFSGLLELLDANP